MFYLMTLGCLTSRNYVKYTTLIKQHVYLQPMLQDFREGEKSKPIRAVGFQKERKSRSW